MIKIYWREMAERRYEGGGYWLIKIGEGKILMSWIRMSKGLDEQGLSVRSRAHFLLCLFIFNLYSV